MESRIRVVGFEKAFDTMEHNGLWTVLKHIGIDQCYAQMLNVVFESERHSRSSD